MRSHALTDPKTKFRRCRRGKARAEKTQIRTSNQWIIVKNAHGFFCIQNITHIVSVFGMGQHMLYHELLSSACNLPTQSIYFFIKRPPFNIVLRYAADTALFDDTAQFLPLLYGKPGADKQGYGVAVERGPMHIAANAPAASEHIEGIAGLAAGEPFIERIFGAAGTALPRLAWPVCGRQGR